MLRRLSASRKRSKSACATMQAHTKCRNAVYLNGPKRGHVPDDKVAWKVPFPEYKPVCYTAPIVKEQPVWADNPSKLNEIKFNSKTDSDMSRVSFMGDYDLDKATGMPLNPRGRTGIRGRGLLGRFGPNFAADPVVTKWRRDDKGNKVKDEKGRPILEMVCIKRRDTGEWAIPGGMVDPDEQVSATLAREFGEEALNTTEMSKRECEKTLAAVREAFKCGEKVYCGYVDDPRNTDNAWMETTVMNFHDDKGNVFGAFKLNPGDDAGAVTWVPITSGMALYACHYQFVKDVYKRRTGSEL